jgi:hypothetical protein
MSGGYRLKMSVKHGNRQPASWLAAKYGENIGVNQSAEMAAAISAGGSVQNVAKTISQPA